MEGEYSAAGTSCMSCGILDATIGVQGHCEGVREEYRNESKMVRSPGVMNIVAVPPNSF